MMHCIESFFSKSLWSWIRIYLIKCGIISLNVFKISYSNAIEHFIICIILIIRFGIIMIEIREGFIEIWLFILIDWFGYEIEFFVSSFGESLIDIIRYSLILNISVGIIEKILFIESIIMIIF